MNGRLYIDITAGGKNIMKGSLVSFKIRNRKLDVFIVSKMNRLHGDFCSSRLLCHSLNSEQTNGAAGHMRDFKA